ncbi:MAG: hypothetical protein EA356_10060 [Geminicoccaceae bacterium]|nr:MAG: hypothetical protein EA356_10060 [Geminicoccaceae bacterium]
MEDLVHRARLQVVVGLLLVGALTLLVVALTLALVPVLGAAGACALVGLMLGVAGGGLYLLANNGTTRPEPERRPVAESAPPNPWIGVIAHAAAVAIVTFSQRKR